ncbi:MAG: hypothetical protein GF317_05965 [Candidatus Lokiarchaeota archaeon]|nr:hypothetical protein [Candidatus Lokiarchaeota archaeon]
MYDDIISYIRERLKEKRKNLDRETQLICYEQALLKVDHNLYRLIKEKLDQTSELIAAIDKDEEIMSLIKKRKEFKIMFLESRKFLIEAYNTVYLIPDGTYKINLALIDKLINLSQNIGELAGMCDGDNIKESINMLKERKKLFEEHEEKIIEEERQGIYGGIKS